MLATVHKRFGKPRAVMVCLGVATALGNDWPVQGKTGSDTVAYYIYSGYTLRMHRRLSSPTSSVRSMVCKARLCASGSGNSQDFSGFGPHFLRRAAPLQ